MKATRRAQPFRKSLARTPGPALSAALKGRSFSGWNPADVTRAAMLSGRPKRQTRPARPKRPPR